MIFQLLLDESAPASFCPEIAWIRPHSGESKINFETASFLNQEFVYVRYVFKITAKLFLVLPKN